VAGHSGTAAARRPRLIRPSGRGMIHERMRNIVLTTYQREHLLPVYRRHGPELYPETVQASRAHVVMLTEQGLISQERGRRLLTGLEKLRREPMDLPEYDGSFEDVYFAFERKLSAASGVDLRDLDVQLARSRNDLDAGIFRMILRRQAGQVEQALLATAAAALDAAARTTRTVIIGLTHRRPAQPTTLAHVLVGYAEAVLSELDVYEAVLDELQRSPFGSCAFAGTDLPIDPQRVADLLGFDERIVNSYEAVAGADHLMAVGFANARSLATGARLARLILDWMTWQWIETPPEFCQGSSIMPQKRNPVVLEHMVSMAGQAAADAGSVVSNVSAAWWEDSNNATTDVQERLWESNERARHFFTLMARILTVLTPSSPPSAEAIVATGATTTAAADALTRAGVGFRGAHSTMSRLVDHADPAQWTRELVRDTLAQTVPGAAVGDAELDHVIDVARDPRAVLTRVQDDGPGADAVAGQIQRLQERLDALSARAAERSARIEAAADALGAEVESRLA